MTAQTLACRPAQRHQTRSIFRIVADISALWQQRRILESLDEDRLKDLGLSRQDALTEAQRPLWDVPANWRD